MYIIWLRLLTTGWCAAINHTWNHTWYSPSRSRFTEEWDVCSQEGSFRELLGVLCQACSVEITWDHSHRATTRGVQPLITVSFFGVFSALKGFWCWSCCSSWQLNYQLDQWLTGIWFGIWFGIKLSTWSRISFTVAAGSRFWTPNRRLFGLTKLEGARGEPLNGQKG